MSSLSPYAHPMKARGTPGGWSGRAPSQCLLMADSCMSGSLRSSRTQDNRLVPPVV